MSTTLNPDLRRSIRANLKRNLRELGVPSDIVDRIFPDVPAFPPDFRSARDPFWIWPCFTRNGRVGLKCKENYRCGGKIHAIWFKR